MGEWFRDLDYQTAAIGKMHFNGPFDARIRGADRHAGLAEHLREHPPRGGDQRRPWRPFQDPAAVWLNADCRSTGLPAESMQSTYFVDRAIEYLEGSDGDRPFALVVSFYDPHSPFNFPRRWRPRFRPRGVPRPAGLGARPPGAARDLRRRSSPTRSAASRRLITRRSRSWIPRSGGWSGPRRTGSRTRRWSSTSATTATCSASTGGSRSTASTSRPCGSR